MLPHSYNHEEWEMNEASEYVSQRTSTSIQRNRNARKEFLVHWGLVLAAAFVASTTVFLWMLVHLYQHWAVMGRSFQDDNAGTMFLCLVAPFSVAIFAATGWHSNRNKLKSLRY